MAEETNNICANYSHFDKLTRHHVWLTDSGTRVHIGEVAFLLGKPPLHITVVEKIPVSIPTLKQATRKPIRRKGSGRVLGL